MKPFCSLPMTTTSSVRASVADFLRVVGWLGENFHAGDLRPEHIAFGEDSAGLALSAGGCFLRKRSDVALQSGIVANGT